MCVCSDARRRGCRSDPTREGVVFGAGCGNRVWGSGHANTWVSVKLLPRACAAQYFVYCGCGGGMLFAFEAAGRRCFLALLGGGSPSEGTRSCCEASSVPRGLMVEGRQRAAHHTTSLHPKRLRSLVSVYVSVSLCVCLPQVSVYVSVCSLCLYMYLVSECGHKQP